MNQGFRDVLLDTVCAYERGLWALVGLCGVLVPLLLVSLSVVEPGSATYVIVVVDLVSVIVIGAVAVAVLRYCQPK